MPDSDPDRDLDPFDRRIAEILSAEGRLPVTELAARVGLSKTPTQTRLKRLVERGFITGFRAVLSPARFGLDHVAFAEVKLADTREATLTEFNEAVARIREVEECHMIAGGFDYLLKIRTRDMARYRRVLGEKISALPHVASTSSYVVMEAVKDRGL